MLWNTYKQLLLYRAALNRQRVHVSAVEYESITDCLRFIPLFSLFQPLFRPLGTAAAAVTAAGWWESALCLGREICRCPCRW